MGNKSKKFDFVHRQFLAWSLARGGHETSEMVQAKGTEKRINIYEVFQEHLSCGFTRSSKLSLSRPVIAGDSYRHACYVTNCTCLLLKYSDSDDYFILKGYL